MMSNALRQFDSSNVSPAALATAHVSRLETVSNRFASVKEFETMEPIDRNRPLAFETYSNWDPSVGRLATARAPATVASVAQIHDRRDHTRARFRLLRRLQKNHDGEGAAAANATSVDAAIAFLNTMSCAVPYFATLNDDGLAVIEFEDRSTGIFADMTFREDRVVECYKRQPGVPSRLDEWALDSPKLLDFTGSLIDRAP
jgi:hypothetical protein